MTVWTLPAGTTNIADPAIDAFFDKTDSRAWIIRAGDIVEGPPNASATLICDNHKNIWNKGTLRMRPSSASVVHHLDFRNIDQTKFVSSTKKAVTAGSVVGSTVTYTVHPNEDPVLWPGVTSHNFEVGDSFVASDQAPTQYRGTYVVTARTPEAISCVSANPPTGPLVTKGTVRATGVITNDTGLWTTAAGKLDLQGATKLGWTRASATIPTGSPGVPQSVVCDDTLTGWRAGDTVVIAPTGRNLGESSISTMTIQSVSGNTVTFTSGVPAGPSGAVRHERISIPAITRPGMVAPARSYGAELCNLIRNVRISGEAVSSTRGRIHMAIMDTTVTQTQNIKFVEMFNVGPPGVGRWAMHFHKIGDAAAGTVVEGCVARNGGVGSHPFVQHASNGITLKDCFSYNTDQAAFWWDFELASDAPTSGTWDHCGALLVRCDQANQITMGGFALAPPLVNRGMTIRDCFAACVAPGPINSSGYEWPEPAQDPNMILNGWICEGENIAHNNNYGLFTWFNTSPNSNHEIPNFILYRNYHGAMDIGAYNANFRFDHCVFFDNLTRKLTNPTETYSGIEHHLSNSSDVNGFEGRNAYHYFDMQGMGPAVMWAQTVNGGAARLYDAEIVNAGLPFFMHQAKVDQQVRLADLVRVAITPASTGVRRDIIASDIAVNHVYQGSWTRVQSLDDQTAFKISYPTTGDGSDRIITSIPPFATRVLTQSLPNATQGTAYSQTLDAFGKAPRLWSLVDGTTLPPGLALNTATGVISGTPTADGVFSFTVQLRDGDGMEAPKALSINVGSSVTLQITTATLDGAVLGEAYSDTLVAAGGFPPYTWSVT